MIWMRRRGIFGMTLVLSASLSQWGPNHLSDSRAFIASTSTQTPSCFESCIVLFEYYGNTLSGFHFDLAPSPKLVISDTIRRPAFMRLL
jgi:hypothetical protein